MGEIQVMNEKRELEYKLREKAKAGELKPVSGSGGQNGSSAAAAASQQKKRRWDQAASGGSTTTSSNENAASADKWHEAATPRQLPVSAKDMETPMNRVWDPTPGHAESGALTPPDITPGMTGETPRVKSGGGAGRRRWDETPKTERSGQTGETPHISGWAETPHIDRGDDDSSVVISKQAALNANAASSSSSASIKKRSRWDETPMTSVAPQTPSQQTPSFTPSGASQVSMTPTYGAAGAFTPSGATPAGFTAMNLQTPVASMIPMTPEQMHELRYQRELDERNRPLTDEELDEQIPAGYKILPPPDGYVPIRTPARKLTATPTPMQNAGMNAGFRMMQTPDRQGVSQSLPDLQPGGNLPLMKPDDLQYFNKLLEDIDDDSLPPEEAKERKIMKLLLKIKNGTPPMRKSALRQITDKAREFGAGPLFNQILPLLMSPSLEDQERHLLVSFFFLFEFCFCLPRT